MSKKKQVADFESKLLRLEEITSLLENNEIGLEGSLNLFEEGVKLSKECLAILGKAELKVKVLQKELTEINLKELE